MTSNSKTDANEAINLFSVITDKAAIKLESCPSYILKTLSDSIYQMIHSNTFVNAA